jgi:trigger factor
MQVSVENVGKLERKLTVRIPAGDYESQVKTRLAEVGRSVRLKGFRPGKIPPKVIEQRFGSQVRDEAISELIRKSFQEAVGQQNMRPCHGAGNQHDRSAGRWPYRIHRDVSKYCRMSARSTSAASRSTSPVAQVADVDVDTMIETLRQQRRSWSPVERGAQNGDMVLFEYSAQVGGRASPGRGNDRSERSWVRCDDGGPGTAAGRP